jgi:hypothetical protein
MTRIRISLSVWPIIAAIVFTRFAPSGNWKRRFSFDKSKEEGIIQSKLGAIARIGELCGLGIPENSWEL